MFPGSDSSPEDTNLAAAAGIQAMVVKTKPRGRIPSPQECDKGNAKSKTDSKTLLRKKPSQSSPFTGTSVLRKLRPR